jgi:HAE1 family hydrophobic/amphiphilic exporter-1
VDASPTRFLPLRFTGSGSEYFRIWIVNLLLTLVTLGIFSWRRLPVDMMPEVEIPVLSIITEYPGASPETVEREVSKKIEEAVNPIAGVKHVNSISREGLSSVIVEFTLEVQVNDVSQEARAKINAVRRELPEGMKEPVIQKFDFNAMPIMSLAVRSQTMPPRELTNLAERKIKRRLESIAGVSKEMMDIFMQYRWPGNIRELENLLVRAAVIAHGQVLGKVDFPDPLAPISP